MQEPGIRNSSGLFIQQFYFEFLRDVNILLIVRKDIRLVQVSQTSDKKRPYHALPMNFKSPQRVALRAKLIEILSFITRMYFDVSGQ